MINNNHCDSFDNSVKRWFDLKLVKDHQDIASFTNEEKQMLKVVFFNKLASSMTIFNNNNNNNNKNKVFICNFKVKSIKSN
jgi:hypothetical protein